MWFQLLEQTHTTSGTWCVAIDLTNAFSPSLPVTKGPQRQFALQYTFTFLLWWCINSPALYYNLVRRDLDNLSLPQAITLLTLFHDIDDSIIIGPSEQELAITFIWYNTVCKWVGNKSDKNSGYSSSVKFLEVQWCEAC